MSLPHQLSINLSGLLTNSAARFPERSALKLDDTVVTYEMLNEGASRVAGLLKDPDVFGILNVESEVGRPLTTADLNLLTTLASQVTIAIQNSRLFEAEREQRELAEALRQASLALSASLDFDTVLDQLLVTRGEVGLAAWRERLPIHHVLLGALHRLRKRQRRERRERREQDG